jgi:hypothetical protein
MKGVIKGWCPTNGREHDMLMGLLIFRCVEESLALNEVHESSHLAASNFRSCGLLHLHFVAVFLTGQHESARHLESRGLGGGGSEKLLQSRSCRLPKSALVRCIA